MGDAVSNFRAATEANDIDVVMETLAPHAELISPVSGRMVFRGKPDLRILLGAVYGGIGQLHWREEIGDDAIRVVLGDARVFGVRIQDAMVLHLADDGQIERIRPYLRPWLGLTLFVVRLLPMIVRHPDVAWRALRAA